MRVCSWRPRTNVGTALRDPRTPLAWLCNSPCSDERFVIASSGRVEHEGIVACAVSGTEAVAYPRGYSAGRCAPSGWVAIRLAVRRPPPSLRLAPRSRRAHDHRRRAPDRRTGARWSWREHLCGARHVLRAASRSGERPPPRCGSEQGFVVASIGRERAQRSAVVVLCAERERVKARARAAARGAFVPTWVSGLRERRGELRAAPACASKCVGLVVPRAVSRDACSYPRGYAIAVSWSMSEIRTVWSDKSSR